MKITIEYPEYIVCPKCENKMKIDYTHKRIPCTDGIYNINMESPACMVAGKTEDRFTIVSICNNCKVILGMSSRG